GDVVGHGFGRQQVEVLEDHAHFAAESPELGGAVAGDVFVIDQDAATGRWLEHVDQADKGRLARTGMADDAEYFAGFYGHTGGMQRGDRPAGHLIRLLYLVKYNHGQCPGSVP